MLLIIDFHNPLFHRIMNMQVIIPLPLTLQITSVKWLPIIIQILHMFWTTLNIPVCYIFYAVFQYSFMHFCLIEGQYLLFFPVTGLEERKRFVQIYMSASGDTLNIY